MHIELRCRCGQLGAVIHGFTVTLGEEPEEQDITFEAQCASCSHSSIQSFRELARLASEAADTNQEKLFA